MYLQGFLLPWGKGGEKILFQKIFKYIYVKLSFCFSSSLLGKF